MKQIYLDYAAATPMSDEVRAAMQPYFSDKFYNPSATYLAAKAIAADVASARQLVARTIGAKPSEIIFTAGGTEANNLAVRGVMEQYPQANMVMSAVEHDSVRAPAGGYKCLEVPVNTDGIVDVSLLKKAINDNTVLLSVMYVNNEVGSLQPIREISAAINDIRATRQKAGNTLPLWLHSDGCQAPLYLDVHVSRLGVDLMTLNGGKMYGPKQSGMLYVRTGVNLRPQILGGGQERGVRSGTENVAGIVGFATALTAAQANRHTEATRLKSLQTYFFDALARAVPAAGINGSRTARVANNVHITLPGSDNERLMMELDERGIMCAVGSACSASSDEPSHVLQAMGIAEADIRASLRFSMGKTTTKEQIDTVIKELAQLTR